ncbi:MAG: glycoside hydrolase family 3 N-terminal domain-containing protein [Candidatus Rokuibacteriota bacterium]
MAASRAARVRAGLAAAAVLLAACRTVPPPDPGRLARTETRLGQLLLVGFGGVALSDNAELERLLCGAKVAGVIVFGRNIESPEQLRRLTGDAAARALGCTGRPLLVAVDAEGGRVMRLGPAAGYTATLSARDLGDANDLALTELEARRMGAMLREAGINWNLAPVVDVGYNPANPVIVGQGRSFSANPRWVAAQARAFITGMHAEGVLTALKHFPGHGSSRTDSHQGFVDVTDTANAEVELAPYRILVAEGPVDSVMTAHVFNRLVDPRYPATLSPNTIGRLLREDVGWKGLVVSDDLRMAAIQQRYGIERAVVLALGAGVDVLLIAEDRLSDGRSAAEVALGAIRRALARGDLDLDRIESALARGEAFRARVPLPAAPPPRRAAGARPGHRGACT